MSIYIDDDFKIPKSSRTDRKLRKYPRWNSWSKIPDTLSDNPPPHIKPFNSKPSNTKPSNNKTTNKIYIDDPHLKCITRESLDLSINTNSTNNTNNTNNNTTTTPIPIKKIIESKLAFNSSNILNPDIIDISYLNQNKLNRYKRMKDCKNITGFVVNVHDATNFDIDLDIDYDLQQQYQDVISNQYTYQDLEPDFIENPDFTKLVTFNPKIGLTYRCRLKGIGINQSPISSNHIWKSNQICIEVKQLLDRSDGWIICDLSDIDVYQRLLVDMFIKTPTEIINLRNYILARMANEPNPIFYPYSSKRFRNKISKKLKFN